MHASPLHARPGSRLAAPWQQWLASYLAGRVYDATIGPALRQGTEALLGRAHTPAWVPPATVEYTVRDMVQSALSQMVGQVTFDALTRRASPAGHPLTNLLTTSGGMAGARAAGGLAGSAVASIAAQTIVSSVAFTLLDAALANVVGPAVEEGVGMLVGSGVAATSVSARDGSVPQSLTRVDVEQLARNLARNVVSGVAFSLAMAAVGNPAGRVIAGAVPGVAGAVLGSLGSSLVASAAVGIVDALVGAAVASAAQALVHEVRRLVGDQVPHTTAEDVVIVPGDRLSGSVRGVLVPFATALASGQVAAFERAVRPAGTQPPA